MKHHIDHHVEADSSSINYQEGIMNSVGVEYDEHIEHPSQVASMINANNAIVDSA